jgi:lysyl-tRNA synthetase class 1
VLRVYTPELTRYLFAGTRPNTEFTISFDLDVIKIYEDYDKTERIAWNIDKAKDEAAYEKEKRIYELSQVDPDGTAMPKVMPFQIPFRHLCNLIQIADGDIDRTIVGIREKGFDSPGGRFPKEQQIPPLLARCRCAKYWAEECAPEEFRFRLRSPGVASPGAPAAALSEKEAAGIRLLRDRVVADIASFGDDKSCAEAIYQCAADAGLEGKELFRAAYQALIGKDQGPRLANFLRSIDRERLMELLAGY